MAIKNTGLSPNNIWAKARRENISCITALKGSVINSLIEAVRFKLMRETSTLL